MHKYSLTRMHKYSLPTNHSEKSTEQASELHERLLAADEVSEKVRQHQAQVDGDGTCQRASKKTRCIDGGGRDANRCIPGAVIVLFFVLLFLISKEIKEHHK